MAVAFLKILVYNIEACGRSNLYAGSYADVMELVDMQDLGSCVVRRVGSSPFIRTKRIG